MIRARVAAMLTKRVMNIIGYAETPPSAIQGILAADPDVVVMDVHLQGGTALPVLRAVQKARPSTAFVVFSLQANPAVCDYLMRCGVQRCLDKAAEFDQLPDAVEQARAIKSAGAPHAPSHKPVSDAPANADESTRAGARSLLRLGWLPCFDEPGRLYPLQADMPSIMVTRRLWSAMHALLAERRKE
jgi:DNA-binding NarL/FixJ family response regulator